MLECHCLEIVNNYLTGDILHFHFLLSSAIYVANVSLLSFPLHTYYYISNGLTSGMIQAEAQSMNWNKHDQRQESRENTKVERQL